MRIDVVSIFPEYLSPLDLSLIGKARRDGLLDVRVHDLRAHTPDRHRTVDDTPYGGGPGMVMKAEPWASALDDLLESGSEGAVPHLVVPGPGGVPFTQGLARSLAAEPWLAFACGRYEGIDERVYEHAEARMPVTVVSLGDYVLNGGEVAVLAIVEAVARLLPGVIGNAQSLVEESHEDGLLEYPVYTKPAVWADASVERAVPSVLLSGDHGAIAAWRHRQRLTRTAALRPDLLHGSSALSVAGLDNADLQRATPADVGELLTLTYACWLTEGIVNETFAIPAMHETVASMTDSLAEWDTWVLRSAGRLVGSVRGQWHDAVGGQRGEGDNRQRRGTSASEPQVGEAREWYVGRLMVAPDLRGRGLGRWLLERAEALAPDAATAYVLTTGAKSVANQRMYRRAGYRIVDRDPALGTVELAKPRRRT